MDFLVSLTLRNHHWIKRISTSWNSVRSLILIEIRITIAESYVGGQIKRTVYKTVLCVSIHYSISHFRVMICFSSRTDFVSLAKVKMLVISYKRSIFAGLYTTIFISTNDGNSWSKQLSTVRSINFIWKRSIEFRFGGQLNCFRPFQLWNNSMKKNISEYRWNFSLFLYFFACSLVSWEYSSL